MAVVGVAVIFHFVGLVVFPARVVHRHDEGAVDGSAHGLAVELQRGVGACGAYGIAVLVTEGVGERLEGLTQCEREHGVDGAEHLGLALVDGFIALFVGDHLTQFQSVFTELGGEKLAHARGAFGRVGLRLYLYRHEAVFLGEVSHAAESAAVVDGVMEEELHARVVNGLVGTIDDTLQHEVGLLELVVEEEVIVGEFHRDRVAVTMRIVGAQHVEARVHPAPPALSLVVDRLLGRLDAEVGVGNFGVAVVLGEVVDGVSGHGIADRLVLVGCRSGNDLAHHLRADASLGMVLSQAGESDGEDKCQGECSEFVHIQLSNDCACGTQASRGVNCFFGLKGTKNAGTGQEEGALFSCAEEKPFFSRVIPLLAKKLPPVRESRSGGSCCSDS